MALLRHETREKRSTRVADRLTREILARQQVIDSDAVFSHIMFIVKFRRDTGTIRTVQVRYQDDGDD